MRIIIDLQSCQSGSRLGGIGRYSSELAKAMLRNARGHEILLVMNSLLRTPAEEVRASFSNLIPQDKIKIFTVPAGIGEFGNTSTKVRAAEILREAFISSLKPDVVHVSSLFEGLHEEIVTSVGALFPSERTAVTLYDLIPLAQREKYLTSKESVNHYFEKIKNLKRAGLLLSISDYSRLEAIDMLPFDSEKIINISSAADERFRPINVDGDKARELLKKYDINRDFLMYTGSFDQRKNHRNLIQAFGMVPSHVRQGRQLLIVGNGWDGVYQELRNVAKTSGLRENEVVFAGHVADDELLLLYNLCELFVFPSLAEGFGLPALEAMSCGTATIVSNCTSLPEVVGWFEAEFDPRKPQSIAQTITQVLSDKSFKEKLREHGLKQSKKFSWDESARRAIDGFESQLERTKLNPSDHNTHSVRKKSINKLSVLSGIATLSDESLHEISRCIGLNEHQARVISAISQHQNTSLRMGWVSTWNTRCGIAAYSQFLIERIKTTVSIFAPETDWSLQPDSINVKRCWKAGHDDDLTKLYRAIRAANIKVLMIQFNYGFFEFTAFNIFLQKLKASSIRVFVTFHSTSDPSESKRLSSLAGGLSTCENLFVHTMTDFEKLSKLGLPNNIKFLPQGVIENKSGTNIKSQASTNTTIIATYGFALPHKGLKEVLESFSILIKDSTLNYHLLLVNAEYPASVSSDLIAELTNQATQLGINHQVNIISDYLTDEQSLAYLSTAHLIVYAYQNTGESSSAAVRMGLASKSPVLVTPLTIFDDVKDSVHCLKGFHANEIADGLKKTLASIKVGSPDAIRITNNAALWRSAHRFSNIADYILEIALTPPSENIAYQLMTAFVLGPESGRVVYEAAVSPLKSNVGDARAGSFHTTRKAGHLLYGPFISAAPGSYYATVNGEVGLGGVSSAGADVAINSGSQILSTSKIESPITGDVLSTLHFIVPEGGCSDLEVRVVVDEDSDLSISSIFLEWQTIPI